MKSWSLLTLTASLCLWAAHAHPAVTTETLVIARGDDSDTPSGAEAPSTEGPVLPVKLTQMNVTSEVTLRYAHTAVVTRVRNPAHRSQETTFHVLLPETAFISGFTMTLDGKSYKAYVRDKEEAKNIYNAAVSQGVGSALISAKARDSNHFTVSVNVEPNTVAIFNLTYEELLVRHNGMYKHVINLNPGALVPHFTVKVHIKEARSITTLRVPELRSGNEIDASENDTSNPDATIVRSADGREATVSFSPDLDAQRRLMAVYKERTRASQHNAENGFRFTSVEQDNDQDTGILGQFVVQYDVEHSANGEILVNNGYFVHFFAPNLPPLPKHVVFVLDTSISMYGRKLQQLKEAMISILSELSPDDYFNIVEFESSIKLYDFSQGDDVPVPHYSYYDRYDEHLNIPFTLTCPSPATQANVEKAKRVIERLSASGSTNIYRALNTAIDIINKGVNATPGGACATGQAANDSVSRPPPSSEDHQRPEPMVIFLTDGEANVEVSNTEQIIRHVTARNTGDHKAAIFSLAFGKDADRTFLRKLSLRNSGFMRHIYEAADAALQLRDFYRQVASPLLADVRFTYPPEQVKEDSLTKNKFRTYYLGSEAVVAGQLVLGQPIDFEPTIEGFGLADDTKKRRTYRLKPKANTNTGDLPLERLWAYLTIKQLLDQREVADAEEDRDKLKEKALSTALKYSFVTPLTSLVVVKPNATSAVDAESVDKPDFSRLSLGMPQYQHAYAPAPSGAFSAYGAPLAFYAPVKNSIVALESSHNPCVPTPCGPHSLCRNVNNVAECTCLKGIKGIPPDCGTSCLISAECSKHEDCIQGKCINPCMDGCGVQAECIVFNRRPVCVCPHGYTGDPYSTCVPDMSHHHNTTQSYPCEPSPCGPNSACESVNGQVVCECLPQYIGSPPACHPKCTSDSDCQDHLSCIKNSCADPCSGLCGSNSECRVVRRSSTSGCPPDSIGHDAECRVVEHTPVCICKAGYTGDPFIRCDALLNPIVAVESSLDPCVPTPCGLHSLCRNVNSVAECRCLKGVNGTPPNCGSSCVVSAECSKHEACTHGKCVNPCRGGCGVQAECIVFNHRPACVCPHGYAGDPYNTCMPDLSHHHNTTQTHPCEPSPCGPNSACESVNGQVVCECLPQYIGSPPDCHQECTSDSDCRDHLSCIKNRCADPCSDICGSNAECHVVTRSSKSGCPPDSIGHDAECLVVEQHTPVCTCKAGYTGNPFLLCAALLLQSYEVESEEEAVEYDSTPAVFSSSAPAEVTATIAAAPPTPSPLATYRLEEFPWAQDLIDTPSDTLRLRLDNGTEISLRLAKDEKDEPVDAGEACAPSAAGGAGGGFCTYLRRCAAARAFTVQDYQTLYCDRDGYAGVCCPTGDDDQSTTEVASH